MIPLAADSSRASRPDSRATGPTVTPTRHRTLDLLRGLMLVIMTVDHLDLYGPVYRFTYETFGFASAAEGFVLLSGIVAGLVYTRYAVERRLGAKVGRRLRTLWRHHLVLVAALFAYRCWQPDQRPAGSLLAAGAAAVGGVVLLNQEPPLDILALYLVLVALLPLLLAAFRSGHAALALASSAAVWLADQMLSGEPWYPATLTFDVAGIPFIWPPNHFHLLAWQFLFALGVWLGWCASLGALPLARPVQGRLLVPALVLAAVLADLRHGVLLPELPADLLAVGRPNLGWLRLANVALLAWIMVQFQAARPTWARQRWLELLGRQALAVFVWHVGLQLFLRPHYLAWAEAGGLPVRFALLALAVASLTVPAWWRDARRRQRPGPP